MEDTTGRGSKRPHGEDTDAHRDTKRRGKRPTIETLPDDCLWTVIGYMSPRDVVTLGGTSRRMAEVASGEPVWFYHYMAASGRACSTVGTRFPRFAIGCAHAFRPCLGSAPWIHRFRDAARRANLSVYLADWNGVAPRNANLTDANGRPIVSAVPKVTLSLRRYECDSRRLTLTVAAVLNIPPFKFDLWRLAKLAADDDDGDDDDSEGTDNGDNVSLKLGATMMAVDRRLTTSGARCRLSPSVPAWSLLDDDGNDDGMHYSTVDLAIGAIRIDRGAWCDKRLAEAASLPSLVDP